MTRIFSMYTRETMISPVDHRGRYYDLILAGFKLAKRGDVYELDWSEELVNEYGIDMPPMDTMFAVYDRPDRVRLCGLKMYRDHEDYCSCLTETPDVRRCKHLWAADFYIFRSGTYLSKSVELHENFLDGRYYDLRRVDRVFVGKNADIDLEGLGVFVLLSHSAAFLDVFDSFSSRTEVYRALRSLVDSVLKGERVSFKRLAAALWNHDTLRYILGTHDAALILQAVLEFFDSRRKEPHFYNLLRWHEKTTMKCDVCRCPSTADDTGGWKHIVVPTKPIDDDSDIESMRPKTTVSRAGRGATLTEHLKDSKNEHLRVRCKECRSYDFHRVQHVPVSNSKLILIDVHQHPRLESVAQFTIPVSYSDFQKKEYKLVGFLCKDADGRSARGYTLVQYRHGAFWEEIGPTKVSYTFNSNASRVPSVVLYQCVEEGSVAVNSPTAAAVVPRRSVVHPCYPTVPLALATPRSANGTRRLSI